MYDYKFAVQHTKNV